MSSCASSSSRTLRSLFFALLWSLFTPIRSSYLAVKDSQQRYRFLSTCHMPYQTVRTSARAHTHTHTHTHGLVFCTHAHMHTCTYGHMCDHVTVLSVAQPQCYTVAARSSPLGLAGRQDDACDALMSSQASSHLRHTREAPRLPKR